MLRNPLDTRKYMFEISKSRNNYKYKIISTQVAIIILLIMMIVGLYNTM